MPGRPTIVVAAAIIEVDGAYFVTRRPRGVHLEGAWEFPGGKCEPGESLTACLAREIDEELGVGALVGEEVFAVDHAYDDRVVELHFLRCALAGSPTARLGQEMRWVPRDRLHTLEFPPADAALITRLQSGPGRK
jgi:8-oxo-dGTP diphosphatase